MVISKKLGKQIASLYNSIIVADYMVAEGYSPTNWTDDKYDAIKALQDLGVPYIGGDDDDEFDDAGDLPDPINVNASWNR